MLRVGLTGELGSGKSTVARLLAAHGAVVLSSDEMGRAMMQRGEPVYQAIVDRFGPSVVLPNGQLNRPELARLAFAPDHPRVEELNAIVHPAVLAEQERQIGTIARTQPDAVVVVESALIFTTKHAGTDEPWRKRFDRIVVVTAPDEVKIERFVHRSAGAGLTQGLAERLRAEGAARLAAQKSSGPSSTVDILLVANDADLDALQHRVDRLWLDLVSAERAARERPGS